MFKFKSSSTAQPPASADLKRVLEDVDSRLRCVWITLVALIALMLGIDAGVLSWASGNHPAAAVLAGGGATFAALTLGLLVINAFRRPMTL